MPHFADRLLAAVKAKGNPICVGLDPRFEQLPLKLREKALRDNMSTSKAIAEAYLTFNKAILDALADLVPVCKPQSAFYEELGEHGTRVLAETINYAKKKGYLVIADAKRGDIGATAIAYARAFLGGKGIPTPYGETELGFKADSVTVNPYMGHDTLLPYLDVGTSAGQSIFALVKTSNPGSGDLQDLDVQGRPLYEHVAEMLNKLGAERKGKCGFHNVGAVVGATYPDQMRKLRALMPDAIFLIPGYGAQGGTAEDAALGFVDGQNGGRGAIVNNSRGIIFAYLQEPYASKFGPDKYAEAARASAEKMAAELKAALSGKIKQRTMIVPKPVAPPLEAPPVDSGFQQTSIFIKPKRNTSRTSRRTKDE